MTGKLVGIARQVLKLVLIELLVPGGTLVVLALLLTGSSALAIPEKVAPLWVPMPRAVRSPSSLRHYTPQGRRRTVPAPP